MYCLKGLESRRGAVYQANRSARFSMNAMAADAKYHKNNSFLRSSPLIYIKFYILITYIFSVASS